MSGNSTLPANVVELEEGEYVVDHNYPLCLSLNIIALGILVINTRRWHKIEKRIRKPLFAGWIFFETLLLVIFCLSLVVNEKDAYPSIRKQRSDIVHTILSFHIIAKFTACTLAAVRTHLLVLDKIPRFPLLGMNLSFIFSIFGILVALITHHLSMFKLFRARRFDEATEEYNFIAKLNIAQITLYATLMITNSIFIVRYVGKKLIEKEGYWGYLQKAPSAKLGVIFILDQFIQFIITCLVYSERMEMTRAYLHGTNLSFAIFSTFFFYNTFEDLGNAIAENNRVISSARASAYAKSAQSTHASHNELPAIAKTGTTDALNTKNKNETDSVHA